MTTAGGGARRGGAALGQVAGAGGGVPLGAPLESSLAQGWGALGARQVSTGWAWREEERKKGQRREEGTEQRKEKREEKVERKE